LHPRGPLLPRRKRTLIRAGARDPRSAFGGEHCRIWRSTGPLRGRYIVAGDSHKYLETQVCFWSEWQDLKRRARAIGFIGEIQFSGLTCVRSLCTPLKTISNVKKARCGLRAVNMSAQQVHASHKGVGFSAAITCRCVAIASPSPSSTGHAGWPMPIGE
jgi:hypothetical protein